MHSLWRIKSEIEKLWSKRRHKWRDSNRELGQGATAGAHGNDNWQQVSLSVTCRWVMNAGVNKKAVGWFKNMRSKGAQRGNDGCQLENEIQIEFTCSCSLLLCCGINLASINVMSRNLQHLLHRLSQRADVMHVYTLSLPHWLRSDCDKQCKMENVWPLCCHRHSLWPGGGALSRLTRRGDW